MSPTNGRVTNLTIDGRIINFCPVDGSDLTGGFYIRDNTPATLGGLPTSTTRPNLLNDEFYARFNDDPDDDLIVIGTPGPNSYWGWAWDGNRTIRVETIGSGGDVNKAALISVDESSNPDGDGYFGAIFRDHTFTSFTSPEHEMYYLVFEVKTGSGWRSNSLGHLSYENGGEYDRSRYGHHRVSARVEWFYDTLQDFGREPTGDVCDIFYAYETTDTISGERLTRFCGRTYRPFDPDSMYSGPSKDCQDRFGCGRVYAG